MTILEAKQYLDSFINHEVLLSKYKTVAWHLNRIEDLLHLIGDPQKHLKIIHVAGSKGKGSTCVFTANILKNAGYKIGLYTSPHIYDYKERIRILRFPEDHRHPHQIFSDTINDDEICEMLDEIKPAIEKIRADGSSGGLSFFEVLTALAFYYFYKERVDFVVLETGLGGRLDATNTASSMVCAITPISLEHTHLLGDSLDKIAPEKAAIIKNHGQKVIIAPQEREVKEILKNRCREFDIQPFCVDEEMVYRITRQNLKFQSFDILMKDREYPNLTSPLIGQHQLINGAVALGIIECLRQLGFDIPPQAVYQGMRTVFWPGRLEIIDQKPLIVLDGAHNRNSCQMLVETLRDIFSKKDITLIFGVSIDKQIEAMVKEFDKIVKTVISTQANHPRARVFEAEEVKVFFPHAQTFMADDVKQALDLAYQRTRDEDIILVTGSFFVVSEARRLCIS